MEYAVGAEEWERRCKWDDLSQEEQESCGYGGCGISLFGCIKIIPDFVFKKPAGDTTLDTSGEAPSM